jgi:hypothetical protein
MITRDQAERIAAEVIGSPQDGNPVWELVEFDSGWLVRTKYPEDMQVRGDVTRVVERDSGRVMRFPSSVSPEFLLTDYQYFLKRGKVERPAT